VPQQLPTEEVLSAAFIRFVAAAALALAVAAVSGTAAADQWGAARGAYLFAAADCAACHTDTKNKGAPLAGGAAITTPFGTFFGPNITPDPEHGIGKWSEADFRRALREGKGRDGAYLYPVFPYPSFTGMSDQDIADLYAYLMSRPASSTPSKPQQPKFPFGFRPLLGAWRSLFFQEGPLQPVPGQSAEWNRGRYLVEAVAHCEECHTPRNFLGALDRAHAFAGNPHGPDGLKAPNVTPDPETGIGKWSVADIEALLQTGQTPDFDFVGAGMADVVRGTSQLIAADRHAIAIYLKSLPPQRATGK
jgi:mono/diheme cytochrome c family protein